VVGEAGDGGADGLQAYLTISGSGGDRGVADPLDRLLELLSDDDEDEDEGLKKTKTNDNKNKPAAVTSRSESISIVTDRPLPGWMVKGQEPAAPQAPLVVKKKAKSVFVG
jgi:hypothetical protein